MCEPGVPLGGLDDAKALAPRHQVPPLASTCMNTKPTAIRKGKFYTVLVYIPTIPNRYWKTKQEDIVDLKILEDNMVFMFSVATVQFVLSLGSN